MTALASDNVIPAMHMTTRVCEIVCRRFCFCFWVVQRLLLDTRSIFYYFILLFFVARSLSLLCVIITKSCSLIVFFSPIKVRRKFPWRYLTGKERTVSLSASLPLPRFCQCLCIDVQILLKNDEPCWSTNLHIFHNIPEIACRAYIRALLSIWFAYASEFRSS